MLPLKGLLLYSRCSFHCGSVARRVQGVQCARALDFQGLPLRAKMEQEAKATYIIYTIHIIIYILYYIVYSFLNEVLINIALFILDKNIYIFL